MDIGSVYWIYGRSGAGKTTLAERVAKSFGAVHLDGDRMREAWDRMGLSLDLSDDGRREQNWRAAELALMHAHTGMDVVVSTICPFGAQRDDIADKLQHYGVPFRFVYIEGGKPDDSFDPPA